MDESAAILTTARTLAETLSGSRVYRDYRRSRVRVEEQPELASRLRAYKKTQTAYELKRLREHNSPSFEDEKYISHLHAELTLNEDARLFLESENSLLKLYAQIAGLLNDACEIDLFDLEATQ